MFYAGLHWHLRGYSRIFRRGGAARRLPRGGTYARLAAAVIHDPLNNRGEDNFHRKSHFSGRDDDGVAT